MHKPLFRTRGVTLGRLLPVVAIVIAALALSGTAPAQAPTPKIGVFDAQRISEETEEGKRIQAELEAFRDRKQTEVTEKEAALADLQSQLETQALSLSNDRRLALEKEIQRKALDLKTFRETAGQEMQLEVVEAQDRFQGQLIAVLNNFGQSQKFDLILEYGTVVYASPTIDITTAIIDNFDQFVKPPVETGASGAGN
jgi:Skp family chaperone for outer membrane proteins